MSRRPIVSIFGLFGALAVSGVAFIANADNARAQAYAQSGVRQYSVPPADQMLILVKGRCGKYKQDGTGNCLTPAFYQCQRDWEACSKKCKPNEAKCIDACDVKYAQICGD